MAIQTLTIDPDAAALEDQSILVRNESGGALAAGDLVFVSGWSEANTRFLVEKAQAKPIGGTLAQFVMRSALANLANGEAFKSFRLTGQDTSLGAVGDAVYLDNVVAGGFALTVRPFARQIVGRIAVVNALTGEIELFVQADSDSGFIRTLPTTGKFPIRALHRNAQGDVDVEFDDVAAV